MSLLPFQFIPESLRFPGQYIEFDGRQAGLSDTLQFILLYGQKLGSGTAPVGEIFHATSEADVNKKTGARSMLADMMRSYRKNDKVLDVYVLPLGDLGGGVAATCPLTVTQAPTEAGTIPLYIDDQPITIPVNIGMTTAALATAISTAITNAIAPALLDGRNIPCDASVAGSVATLTALHKGTAGNAIDVRLALYGEAIPAGLGLTIGGFSNGAGDPVPPNLEALLQRKNFRGVALGINNLATNKAWGEELMRRWQPVDQKDAQAFTAHRGDYATASAYGEIHNYELVSDLSLEINPTSPWRAAAMYAAQCVPQLIDNPSQSLEGRKLIGMTGVSYHTWRDANSLLFKGMSIMEVAADGSCYIKRPITTYQRRPDGSADDSYLDVNTVASLAKIRYFQGTEGKKFIGSSAAKNAEGFAPGKRIVTVDSVKTMLLRLYKDKLQYQEALVQDYPFYKENLTVVQNPTNPSRFDFVDTPVLVSPYYILAGRNEFRKVAE